MDKIYDPFPRRLLLLPRGRLWVDLPSQERHGAPFNVQSSCVLLLLGIPATVVRSYPMATTRKQQHQSRSNLNSLCHVSSRWASGARATLFLMILSLSSPSLDPNSQDAALQCGCACHYVRQRIRLSSLCKPFSQRFALDGPIVANMCSLVNQHHCFSASHIISDSDTVLEREPRQPSGPLRDIVTTAKS